MKRNLLSSVIIAALMSTSLVACDDKKEDKPATQATKQAAEKTESPASSAPEVDSNTVLNQKLNVYIECYNTLQTAINRNVNGYADKLADFRAGPTGQEPNLSLMGPVYPAFISDCRNDIKRVAQLKPNFEPLDSAALAFSDAAPALATTINDMNKYYDQQDYKDDNFAGAKEFHKKFISQYDAFGPIAKNYIENINIMSRERSVNDIKATEQKEGKSIKYYTLLTILEAETINDGVSGDDFNVASVSKQLAEFGDHIKQLSEKVNADIDKHRSFPGYISELEKFQAAVKKRLRRVRDKVAYDEHDTYMINNGNGRLVEGTHAAVVDAYNDLIDTYNSYHLEREF